MNREDVMRWVDEYERAWRASDPRGAARLFTETARYRRSPYEEPLVGHAEIEQFWPVDEGRPFTMTAQPVAVDGRDAVVRVQVGYGEPAPQEYRDLWVLRFAADSRVEEFEEWAYWPDKPYMSR